MSPKQKFVIIYIKFFNSLNPRFQQFVSRIFNRFSLVNKVFEVRFCYDKECRLHLSSLHKIIRKILQNYTHHHIDSLEYTKKVKGTSLTKYKVNDTDTLFNRFSLHRILFLLVNYGWT